MARYVVDSKFWDDEKVVQCSGLGKLILLVCITGPQRATIPGLQQATIRTLSEILREPYDWVRGEFFAISERFPTLLQIDEQLRIIRMSHGPRYANHGGAKNIIGWHSNWSHFPNSPLKYAHIPSLMEKLDVNNAAQVRAWNSTFGAELSGQYYIGERQTGSEAQDVTDGGSSTRSDHTQKHGNVVPLQPPTSDSDNLQDTVSNQYPAPGRHIDQRSEIRDQRSGIRDQSASPMRDPRSPSTPRSSSTDVPRPNGGTHRVEAAEYASAHWPGLVALGRSLGATDEQVRIAADAMVRKCPGLKSVSEWEQTANNYVSTQVWIDNQPKDERSSVPARRRSTAGDVALEGKYADTLRMHKTNLERK